MAAESAVKKLADHVPDLPSLFDGGKRFGEDDMNEAAPQATNGSRTEKPVYFPRADGSRVPFKVYSSPEIYQLEQERIFRGPVWSFVAMEAEIPRPGDFKSTFVGDTPVVVTRTEDNGLAVWVNRCAHRGALVCRSARGNTKSHICAYHQLCRSTNFG